MTAKIHAILRCALFAIGLLAATGCQQRDPLADRAAIRAADADLVIERVERVPHESGRGVGILRITVFQPSHIDIRLPGSGYQVEGSIWDVHDGRYGGNVNFSASSGGGGEPVAPAPDQTISDGWLLGRTSGETTAELARVNEYADGLMDVYARKYGQPEQTRTSVSFATHSVPMTAPKKWSPPGHRIVFNLGYWSRDGDARRPMDEVRLKFQVRRQVFAPTRSLLFSERDAAGTVTMQTRIDTDYQLVSFAPIPIDLRWTGTPPVQDAAPTPVNKPD
jgi:hypothetical protein